MYRRRATISHTLLYVLLYSNIYSEKECEYNEAVHQLFIDFKKAYYSVSRQVLYNIVTEFGIAMKLVRLVKCV